MRSRAGANGGQGYVRFGASEVAAEAARLDLAGSLSAPGMVGWVLSGELRAGSPAEPGRPGEAEANYLRKMQAKQKEVGEYKKAKSQEKVLGREAAPHGCSQAEARNGDEESSEQPSKRQKKSDPSASRNTTAMAADD